MNKESDFDESKIRYEVINGSGCTDLFPLNIFIRPISSKKSDDDYYDYRYIQKPPIGGSPQDAAKNQNTNTEVPEFDDEINLHRQKRRQKIGERLRQSIIAKKFNRETGEYDDVKISDSLNSMLFARPGREAKMLDIRPNPGVERSGEQLASLFVRGSPSGRVRECNDRSEIRSIERAQQSGRTPSEAGVVSDNMLENSRDTFMPITRNEELLCPNPFKESSTIGWKTRSVDLEARSEEEISLQNMSRTQIDRLRQDPEIIEWFNRQNPTVQNRIRNYLTNFEAPWI